MVDIGMPLREAYLIPLEGNVVINSQAVPFFDEKVEVEAIANANVYVLFSDQSEDEANPNKTTFVNEPLVRLRIVNRRKSTNTKEVVEDISNQILSLLFPTRTTWAITLSYPLRLTYAKYIGGNYNPLVQSSEGFLISKTLVFKNRITQP